MTIFPGDGQLARDDFPASGSNYPLLTDTPLASVIEQCSVFLYNAQPRFLRIASIVGLGAGAAIGSAAAAVHAVDLVLVDSAGATVFDTRAATGFEAVQWYQSLWHLTWSGPAGSVQLICHREPALASIYAVDNAYLDARCVQTSPRMVEDVQVYQAGSWHSALRSDKTIRLRQGYNLASSSELAVSERGEQVFDLRLDAVAGAGLGKFEGCLVEAPLRTIAGQRPNDAGEFFLTGDPCLIVRPKLTFSAEYATVIDGQIELDDLCSPPCTCDDFTEVYQYAKRVWGELKRRAARAEQIRDEYHQVRSRWQSLAQCAESNLLRVKAYPMRPCGIAGVVGFCNPTDEPLRNVTLKVNIVDSGGVTLPGAIDCNSVSQVNFSQGDQFPVPYTLEAPLPDMQVKFDCVPPGRMSFVSFQFTPDSAANGDTVRLCVELVGSSPEGIKSQTRRCHDTVLKCLASENCASTTTAEPYLTQPQADDLYINTNTEIIDGGNF